MSDLCCVCILPLDSTVFTGKLTPCYHRIHGHCALSWVQSVGSNSPTCPLCRTSIERYDCPQPTESNYSQFETLSLPEHTVIILAPGSYATTTPTNSPHAPCDNVVLHVVIKDSGCQAKSSEV